jgi:hypothetical protein
MIREGAPDVTLQFLAGHRNMLAISSFTDGAYIPGDGMILVDAG